jgi:hypothetical protein
MFLLSPKAANIKLMDVGEFITKFKDKFEPKKELPKPLPIKLPEKSKIQSPIMKEAIASCKLDGETQSLEELKEITVRKTEPTIILEKLKPTINVLSEPSTPLGKIIVILKAMLGNRNDQWTKVAIKKKIEEHAWSADGMEHEIERLIQWEILAWQPSGKLRFYSDRVRVVEKPVEYDENV